MTGMLASINSLDEAALALDVGADIIDLKQPAAGALGALDIETIRQICRYVNGRRPVSATVGDLPMLPELVFDAAKATAETGIDYIKIGFFPGGDWPGTVQKLSLLTRQNLSLVAVLFADTEPDFAVIDRLKTAGFKGVMLDTMVKKKGSLTDVMASATIRQFVTQVKSRKMLCGLAGSLRLKDIPGLAALQPDYLGFRGALCSLHDRTGPLDQGAMVRVKRVIERADAEFSCRPSDDLGTEFVF